MTWMATSPHGPLRNASWMCVDCKARDDDDPQSADAGLLRPACCAQPPGRTSKPPATASPSPAAPSKSSTRWPQSREAAAMAEPHVTGTLYDQRGRMIQLGADNGSVTVFMPAGRCTLPPDRAEDFAQLYVRACWDAAAQRSPDMTDAQRAELAAAAEEMCLADCGARVHDETCKGAVTGG